MTKEDILKQLDEMGVTKLCDMMESKVTMVFTLSELMELSTAIELFMDSPLGLISELINDGELAKLKKRLDSKITIRLGTYGIFVDDMEEE